MRYPLERLPYSALELYHQRHPLDNMTAPQICYKMYKLQTEVMRFQVLFLADLILQDRTILLRLCPMVKGRNMDILI